MTSGFGVDKVVGGSGTNSSDIRKIQGGLYTPGIISGCVVTTSPTTMQYTISAGVVAISTATGEIVLAPVAQTTIPTDPATTRTDIIYVQQRYPSIEGDANVVVSVDTSVPDRAVEIRRYSLTAGQTNTNQAVISAGVGYSVPYGATLGRLHYYQHTAMGLDGDLPNSLTSYGHGSFTLPTDRMVKFKVFAILSARWASGFDNANYCEYGFIPNGGSEGDFVLWQTGGLHQAWESHYYETTIPMPAGDNTCFLRFLRIIGPGQPVGHYGLGGDGYGRRGIEFSVWDDGPIV